MSSDHQNHLLALFCNHSTISPQGIKWLQKCMPMEKQGNRDTAKSSPRSSCVLSTLIFHHHHLSRNERLGFQKWKMSLGFFLASWIIRDTSGQLLLLAEALPRLEAPISPEHSNPRERNAGAAPLPPAKCFRFFILWLQPKQNPKQKPLNDPKPDWDCTCTYILWNYSRSCKTKMKKAMGLSQIGIS